MNPKVSVIVPVYKVERYLDRCVQSIRNQTLRDIEIILVDDGSPDNCPAMCDNYARLDSRIKVVHKQNAGLGMARNSGVEVATGEYVTFCDSDDWIDEIAYEHIYSICKRNDLDMCSFQDRRVKIDGTIIEQRPVRGRKFSGKDEITDFILGLIGKDYSRQDSETYGMSSCMALFRRELFEISNVRYPSEREVASEDLIFLINFAPYMERVEIVSDVYYNYLINPASISRNYSEEKFKRLMKMLDAVKEYCDNRFSLETYINHYYTQQLRIFKVALKFISYGKEPFYSKLCHLKRVTRHPYLKDFYKSDVIASYPLSDRIYIAAMKYNMTLFFILLYKFRR